MWKVYKITNKTYNEEQKCYKSYIGMTLKTVEERFSGHIKEDGCKIFHAAIKKYGKDNWVLEILEDNIKTEAEALEKEEFYIKKFNTLVKNKKGYNILQSSGGREVIDGKVKCVRCCLYKNVECFWKDKTQKSGYNSLCIDCKREYVEKNKDFLNIRKKQYREENKEEANEKNRINCKMRADKNKLLSIEELHTRTPVKLCSCCKILKNASEFSRDNYKIDGFVVYCKKCVYKKDKRRNNFNPDD